MAKSLPEKPQPNKLEELLLSMPELHPETYRVTKTSCTHPMSVNDKAAFLKNYFITGNLTKSAKLVGFNLKAFTEQMKSDAGFTEDFLAIKEAIVNDLEETMRLNARNERGYMDRITWLRANSEKYNPEKQISEGNMSDAIKALSERLKDYSIVPKSNILEAKDESDARESA